LIDPTTNLRLQSNIQYLRPSLSQPFPIQESSEIKKIDFVAQLSKRMRKRGWHALAPRLAVYQNLHRFFSRPERPSTTLPVLGCAGS
jgi:hypothetical protein